MNKVVRASLLALAGVAALTQSFAQAPVSLGSQPQTSTPTATAPAAAVTLGSKPQTTTPTTAAPASAVTMGTKPQTSTPSAAAPASAVTMGTNSQATKPTAVGPTSAVRLGTAPTAKTAAAGAAANPCAAPVTNSMAVVSLGSAKPGKVEMSEAEYKAYTDANTQTTPATKADAFEAYLAAYPNSSVKQDTLQQIMYIYSAAENAPKTLSAADRLLAVDPCNFYAEVFEVQLNRDATEKLPDGPDKVAGYDKAAVFAKQGLAASKPKTTDAADWTAMKLQGYPVFWSVIGADDLAKKDSAGAIKAFQAELASVPVEQTTTPGLPLFDTYFLAQAYYTLPNPDYLKCAYYAARASNYVAAEYKQQFKDLAVYCFRRYHGADDGLDAVTTVAKDNLTPPAGFGANITLAPKPIDMVKQLVDTTPDLSTLAISDREFAMTYGQVLNPKSGADASSQKTYADQVFDASKGKTVEIPDAVVIAATESMVSVAVSDEAVSAKTADFVFTMKAPLTVIPAVGTKVTLTGTYVSYTPKPLVISMSDGEVVEKVVPVKKAPVKAGVRKK